VLFWVLGMVWWYAGCVCVFFGFVGFGWYNTGFGGFLGSEVLWGSGCCGCGGFFGICGILAFRYFGFGLVGYEFGCFCLYNRGVVFCVSLGVVCCVLLFCRLVGGCGFSGILSVLLVCVFC